MEKNMDKKAIRKEIFKRRREADPAKIQEDSRIICQKIIESPLFQNADSVYVYMDCKGEVSVKLLLETAWKLGKKTAAPKVTGPGEMKYCYIQSYEDVARGYYDIPEPITQTEAADEDALLIVPGVAFDCNRHRCGYGQGFYDRYLAAHKKHPTIAIAFDFQIVPEVPADEFDIFPQMLITEKEVFPKTLQEIGQRAKDAEPILRIMQTSLKDEVLKKAAEHLVNQSEELLRANAKDIANARANGMAEGMVDRLALNESRIQAMAEGLVQIAGLDDPIGEVLSMKQRPNGLMIGKKRVPLGVVGIIYESRPNVTADAFGLCFKTGNAVILKGGSDAIYSNIAIVKVIRDTLRSCGVTEDAIQLIEDTNRETTAQFMKMNEYVDVLIPRGGAGLIKAVVNNSTIPVIETGTGNCHIYVDENADLDMAVNIIFNAKTQRIGVCNACESLVVHEKIKDQFLPVLQKRLEEKHVELRGDEAAIEAVSGIKEATEEDWGREYLDYILSIKTVSSLDEAIHHINKYNTGHSEAIITKDYDHAQRFLNEIDAAAVYVNASTRFTDGFEFGFGAEIGISTQKLHARGPMGLEALTSSKYIIYGNGQVRP